MPLLNKILICDDEDAIAHLLAMALGDAGFLCLRARDGEQAVAMARHDAPELCILDVMMPKIDGVRVCQQLKADPRLARVPVLMLSSLTSVGDKVKGLDAGADDYLSKPFDLRELLARVKALLRASRRSTDRSALTGLPGAAALEDAVEARLATGEPLALLHAGLAGYHAFVEAHGWARGEELIGAVGRALATRAVELAETAFVAHLGGGDFGLVAAGDAHAHEKTAAALAEAAEQTTVTFGEPRVTVGVTVVDRASLPSGTAATAEGLSRALAAARKRAGRSQSPR